jgi:hypothetical protein
MYMRPLPQHGSHLHHLMLSPASAIENQNGSPVLLEPQMPANPTHHFQHVCLKMIPAEPDI